MPTSPAQIANGERFAFGDNWHSFVGVVDESRIRAATDSLTASLDMTDLSERTFLDIGCGSGLFSLAAHRLGARVRAFDYDERSVAASKRLRERFAPDGTWTIEQGSVLDTEYTEGLGTFDVVYAWGVLHHTGDMWRALDVAARRVALGGTLFVSIYNDQGSQSHAWLRVKRLYNQSGPVVRSLLIFGSRAYLGRGPALRALYGVLRRRRTPLPAQRVRGRGMSARHDLLDWVGGYPFEVAKPEDVLARVRCHGFELRHLMTCAGGIGCNEYVFQRLTVAEG